MWICYYTDITNQLTTRLTLISIASARKAMPDCEILIIHPIWHSVHPSILLAANYAQPIKDLPKDGHYDYRRCMANSQISGDYLFIDTDTIIQKDLIDVWASDFDIAIARRTKIFDSRIPYNMGVCFSRSPLFWAKVAAQIPKNAKGYIEPERAFSRVCQMAEFNAKVLPDTLYNHTPDRTKDDVSHAYIVHYKGVSRKNMMLNREHEFIT